MWTKWAQAFRTAFTFAVLVVIALSLRWDAWNDAWTQRTEQARSQVIEAYQMGLRDAAKDCRKTLWQPETAFESSPIRH